MTTTPERRERFRGNLATLMNALRPEWDVAGCLAALRALPPDFPLSQVALCAMRYCGDDRNQTPAMFADLGNVAWESDWYLPCKTHPETRARHTTGECAACRTDRLEAPPPEPTTHGERAHPLREAIERLAG